MQVHSWCSFGPHPCHMVPILCQPACPLLHITAQHSTCPCVQEMRWHRLHEGWRWGLLPLTTPRGILSPDANPIQPDFAEGKAGVSFPSPLWGLSSLSHHGLKTLFYYQMQTWWPRLSTAGQINTEPQELLIIFSGKTREPSIELWLQKLDTYCRRRRWVRERVMVLWRYWHVLFALE